ncbi:MAG: 5-formyltetrahydrofolate cyclo-ligase [Candidatus Kapabacteria bacterium]|nr:5-formyltetrahydrofolate cyclo-ligase [Candidatus Kapabacteria bacterium]
MTKAEIRAAKLSERAALTEQQRHDYSIAIAEHLWAMPEYIMSGAIHVYLAIREEVETEHIIERAWEEGKTVIVPLVEPHQSELRHAVFTKGTVLASGPYGIPQPVNAALLSADEIAILAPLILVPVVAFNSALYRIGYGKGYYDRFLSTVPYRRIGLAYAMQHAEFQPDAHDVPLDAVVTEHGVLRRW